MRQPKTKKQWEARKRIQSMIKLSSHWNEIKLHKSTSTVHRTRIFEICNYLIDHDIDFLTEVTGKDGTWRADILAMTFPEGRCYEVYFSEEKESLEKKKKKYPIEVSFINANKLFDEKELY